MGSIKRINEMEAALVECRAALDELEKSMDRVEGVSQKMGELFSYYGSADWYEDREMELPSYIKAGVLSEDLVYDEITDARDLSFRMLELATDILKNKI